MYNSMDNFLNLETSVKSIADYDFKNESAFPEIINEKVSIKKFFAYKTHPKSVDCDSCKLADDIYKTLWDWSYAGRDTISDSLRDKVGVNWERYSPDTMNSFKTIYNHALILNKSNEDKTNSMYLLQKFSKLTHTIGNFTLVPFTLNKSDKHSFNQYRGFNLGNYFVYDFFDLSLKIIKENIGNDAFKRYVDTFLLHMYVDKDYNIKPLFKGHEKFLKQEKLDLKNPKKFLPKSKSELNEYLSNANRNIEARSEIIAPIIISPNERDVIEKNIWEKKEKKIPIKLDITSLILFFPVMILLKVYLQNISVYFESYGNKYADGGPAQIGGVELIVVTLILTVISRAILWVLGLKLWKCPHCKKKFVFKELYTRRTSQKPISIKVINDDKNSVGKVVRTSEQYVPGTRSYYETIHKCKKCEYEKHSHYSRDEINK